MRSISMMVAPAARRSSTAPRNALHHTSSRAGSSRGTAIVGCGGAASRVLAGQSRGPAAAPIAAIAALAVASEGAKMVTQS
ncbi:Uncharacterised protein [Mycobacteroides abscessus subsp. massiliense]|nr:Uncharacterised protein [Mycobacteroides abscessus subsp. massiliense]